MIALIGVLVTTGVLVGGQARARHRLRDELDLVSKMDGLSSRAAYVEYVDDTIQLYVDRRRQEDTSDEELARRLWWSLAVLLLGNVCAVIAVVGVFLEEPTSGPWWSSLSGWLLLTLLGAALEVFGLAQGNRALDQRALRRIGESRRLQARQQDQPGEEP